MNRTGKILFILCIAVLTTHAYSDTATGITAPVIDRISHTVIQIPLKPGVTSDNAVNAIISKANELNMSVSSHQKISEKLQQRGITSRHLEILQLCQPEKAAIAIELNLHFAAYMPCRLTLVEDENGQIWILMQNIAFQVNDKLLKPASVEFAIRINQDLLSIVTAGVNGHKP